MTTKTEAIRALNDELRQNLTTGTAFMTAGVAALGAEAVARIVKTIAVYDDFCHANDPYEEHDFGSFEVDGHTIFFKIDYFDKARASLAGPDRSVGHRARDHDHVGGRILTVSAAIAGTNVRRTLTTPELRHAKLTRDEFLARPRRPITVVLDSVTQNYNIGAIFRLCEHKPTCRGHRECAAQTRHASLNCCEPRSNFGTWRCWRRCAGPHRA